MKVLRRDKLNALEFTLVVYASNPFRSESDRFPECNCSALDWREVASLANGNKVALNLSTNIQRNSRIRGIFPEEIVKKIEETACERQQRSNALLAEIPAINRILQRDKIDWILIKTLKMFPTEFSDIDVLLPSSRYLSRAVRSLKKNGYQIRATASEPEKVKMHKTCVTTAGQRFSCVVDLHGKVTQDGLQFLDEKKIWMRKRTNEKLGIEVPSDEDDFLITAINSFFGDNVLYLRDAFHLIGLARRKIDWRYIVESATKFGWISALLTVLHYIELVNQMKKTQSPFFETKLRALKRYSSRFAMQTLSHQRLKICLPMFYPLRTNVLSSFFKVCSDLSRRDADLSCHARHVRRIVGARLFKDPRLAYVYGRLA